MVKIVKIVVRVKTILNDVKRFLNVSIYAYDLSKYDVLQERIRKHRVL